MRKKEFWDYDRPDSKASESSLGSRLVRILLVCGCITAGATILLSLFFYFFPTEAIRSVHAMRTFAEDFVHRIQDPPDEPSVEGITVSQTLQQISPAVSATVVAAGIKAAASVPIPEPENAPSDNEPDIPLITFSSAQGDINNIGQSDEEVFLNEDYLVMLDSAMGPMLYYNQGDSRWSDYLYGGMDAMSEYGCGPTVAAMLINSFTKYAVIPPNIADWSAENGCHAPHNGSYHSIIMKTLSAYGLQVESAAGADYDTAAELLRSGHVLIALMGRGTFSGDGHFIIITNILENGNVHIADSYSLENTKMEWDLSLLLSEMKHSRDDGGPLWAVTYPEENE